MNRSLVTFPLAALFCATAVSGEERCLAAEYRLPDAFAEEMRPYIACGLIQGRDPHVGVRLNGQPVHVGGAGADFCARVRQSAFEASETRLASTMADADVRRLFLQAEFERADAFLRVAARSTELTIDKVPSSAECRQSNG